MSEYAHFRTLSHHQLQSCRHISRGLPPVAVSEKQAAVGEILKKGTVSAALPFPSPGTGGGRSAQGKKRTACIQVLS